MTETIQTRLSLAVPFPERRVFLRLGGRLSRTKLAPDEEAALLQVALRAYETCRLQGRWRVFPAQSVAQGILLADGRLLPGAEFAAKNPGIRAVWCAAVTAGAEIVAYRDARKRTADAAVCDAVGSECADAALELMQHQAAVELRPKSMLLSESRYSPGYGDMPLAVQRFFFAELKLEELGMTLTENCFIHPEKSVTAFAGIN